MTQASRSVAMSGDIHASARAHLLRSDGQEDLCFALWTPSKGKTRFTALIHSLVLPEELDRQVHGNASFNHSYFERAISMAVEKKMGIALMHSHPLGEKWQGMSPDDIKAEQTRAGAVLGATGLPFLGLTIAGDAAWSARFWERIAPRTFERHDCATVRVVGEALKVTFYDKLAPPPIRQQEQTRTVSAWGEDAHKNMTRLRIGLVGAGSVGGFIAATLAHTGFEDISVIEFDVIKRHNLDRLMYATKNDIGKSKIEVLEKYLMEHTTASAFRITPTPYAVYEDQGFKAALDCDILFSCVDRPWGRHVLNLLAYAHHIPVIDGGIAIRTTKRGTMAAADWKAHTSMYSRRCLHCLGQYDTGLVQVERDGYLDDPAYIANLPKDHPLKASENVYAFSMACASLQVLQMLTLVLSPLDQGNPGAELHHFVGNITETPIREKCFEDCIFPTLSGMGDTCAFDFLGPPPRNRGN